jgi:GH18 family chitinase
MYDPRRHRAHAVGGRRAPPLSLLALLLPSRLAATTSANAEVHANAVPRDNATRIMAYYGPANYNDLAGRTRPPNVDYAKLDRIMYGPYRINSAGSLWGNDANVDSQMLFGPRNWNPDPGDVEYCHYDTEDNDAMNCGYHEYDMGLLGMAHSRGVQVYPTIGGGNGRGKDDDDGGGGGGGWDEEFSIMASDPDARTRVSRLLDYFVGMDVGMDLFEISY